MLRGHCKPTSTWPTDNLQSSKIKLSKICRRKWKTVVLVVFVVLLVYKIKHLFVVFIGDFATFAIIYFCFSFSVVVVVLLLFCYSTLYCLLAGEELPTQPKFKHSISEIPRIPAQPYAIEILCSSKVGWNEFNAIC